MGELVGSSLTPETTLYECSHCGISPLNRSGWCALGCGSDYNRMTAIPLALLVAVYEALQNERPAMRGTTNYDHGYYFGQTDILARLRSVGVPTNPEEDHG